MNVSNIPAEKVEEIVRELDTTGFACLPNYVQTHDLASMQLFVASAVNQSAHQYVHFNDPKSLRGSGLDEMGRSPEFLKLMSDLFESSTRQPSDNQELYQVLRCLTGNSGQRHSMIFHYDSYLVTALVPIQIPSHGRSGDLLLYPNTRRLRRLYLLNVIDKLLLDNPLTQKILRLCVNTEKLRPVRIKMLPGNLYLFWGYRSIHTNEPCDPDQVRATALFHYANPHNQSLGALRDKWTKAAWRLLRIKQPGPTTSENRD